MQAVAAGIDVKALALVVQAEAITGEPIGDPAGQGTEAGFSGGEIPGH